MTTKNKPAGHIKKGDKLVYESAIKRRVEIVSKVEELPEDESKIKVTFPATSIKLNDGSKFVTSPGTYLIFNKNEQVYYES